MLKCPKCGKEAPSEAIYCPYCGSKLRTSEINVEALRMRLEELRHDEKICLFISVIGLAFLLFGVWLYSLTMTRYEWRGLIPYEVTYHPYADMAVIFMIAGAIVLFAGLTASAFCYHSRSKLLKRLQ
jgi:hypothetical protein